MRKRGGRRVRLLTICMTMRLRARGRGPPSVNEVSHGHVECGASHSINGRLDGGRAAAQCLQPDGHPPHHT